MARMSRIKFQTQGTGKEWIWIPPTEHCCVRVVETPSERAIANTPGRVFTRRRNNNRHTVKCDGSL